MKYTLSLLCCAILFSIAQAQTPRKITLHPIGKDSINLAMNDRYNLVDDTCASFIRYAHYNFSSHKFFGKFKDVAKDKPDLVRTEGAYTADGLKDGEFIARYNNGNILAKGAYKNDKYVGKWEVLYRNGKPEMNFEAADDGSIKIMDLWDNKGVKVIDGGKGSYHVNMGSIVWKGDLLNGSPDGDWTAVSRASVSQNIIISEVFKKGKFVKGKSQGGDYTDASRIVLIDPNMLPYATAEQLIVAPNGCEIVKTVRTTAAKLPNGSAEFNEAVKNLISPYLGTVSADLKRSTDEVVFEGMISSEGLLGSFNCKTLFDATVANGIMQRLIRLPAFVPATVNGKPVSQGITVTFTFKGGVYSFSYKLLPLKTDQ